MIWLRVIAAFVVARLKRSLEILQRIKRDICLQKTWKKLERKIRNLGSLYALINKKKNRKPEENPSREDEKVPAKTKDARKRLFCERTPDQNNRSPSLKSQRVKSPEKVISFRKSLSFGKDAESRQTSVQNEITDHLYTGTIFWHLFNFHEYLIDR